MTIREALLSMGYKEVSPKHWLKPIGHQVFSYYEDENEWRNRFKRADGRIGVWDKHHFSKNEGDSSFLHQLKSFECCSRLDMSVNSDSQFELPVLDL